MQTLLVLQLYDFLERLPFKVQHVLYYVKSLVLPSLCYRLYTVVVPIVADQNQKAQRTSLRN
jgi:hypothetical protein